MVRMQRKMFDRFVTALATKPSAAPSLLHRESRTACPSFTTAHQHARHAACRHTQAARPAATREIEQRAFFSRGGTDKVLGVPLDARIQRAAHAARPGQAHWVPAGGKRVAL